LWPARSCRIKKASRPPHPIETVHDAAEEQRIGPEHLPGRSGQREQDRTEQHERL